MAKIIAHIGLGSNMGDRRALMREAVRQISAIPGVHFLKQSSVVETKPIGPVSDQPDFLNSVLSVETELSALELLDQLLAVEQKLGRIREKRWGPRTIDLDLLLYGQESIDHPRLKIPHPEIHKRSFVLSGLSELGVSPQ